MNFKSFQSPLGLTTDWFNLFSKMHQNQFLNFLCSLSRIVIFSTITQIKQSLEFCFVDKKIVNEACLGIAYICNFRSLENQNFAETLYKYQRNDNSVKVNLLVHVIIFKFLVFPCAVYEVVDLIDYPLFWNTFWGTY